MRAIAILQQSHQSAHPHKHRARGRSPLIPQLSTAMPQLQRQCACGGSCPRCQTAPALPTSLQTKLQISEPGDRYEQEADRVAEQVMRMPEPEPEVDLTQEPTTMLQRKASDAVPTTASLELGALQSTGQALQEDARAFFEPRFGTDLSQVRIHTHPPANDLASTVHARAFTFGQNIVFGAGQYLPNTDEGKRLLAHELTHVMQQTGGQSPETPTLQRQALFITQSFPLGGLQRQEETDALQTGGNACLNQCEEEFNRCIRNSRSSLQCQADRSTCMHRCPPSTPPTSGGERP